MFKDKSEEATIKHISKWFVNQSLNWKWLVSQLEEATAQNVLCIIPRDFYFEVLD